MIESSPICSVCTRDWDERLGYCEDCLAREEVAEKVKAGWRYTPGGVGMLEDNFS